MVPCLITQIPPDGWDGVRWQQREWEGSGRQAESASLQDCFLKESLHVFFIDGSPWFITFQVLSDSSRHFEIFSCNFSLTWLLASPEFLLKIRRKHLKDVSLHMVAYALTITFTLFCLILCTFICLSPQLDWKYLGDTICRAVHERQSSAGYPLNAGCCRPLIHWSKNPANDLWSCKAESWQPVSSTGQQWGIYEVLGVRRRYVGGNVGWGGWLDWGWVGLVTS